MQGNFYEYEISEIDKSINVIEKGFIGDIVTRDYKLKKNVKED